MKEIMGAELSERARAELAGAAAANHVNAQTALAQGITARKGGAVVEALSYYYQAAAFDSSLLEAANRAKVMSADISSGRIGENVRNDITDNMAVQIVSFNDIDAETIAKTGYIKISTGEVRK
jgi:hypothetical protein